MSFAVSNSRKIDDLSSIEMSLISIIIPNFNREHLISETLDSIINQTYTNWECLIIDDGSTDNSLDLLKAYEVKDSRFRIFLRPSSKPKGANACRNIGLENAKGDYIVFFDSDDLMTPNHLEVKKNAIVSSDYDFVITRTKYFNGDNAIVDSYYTFDNFEISAYNYITKKINWLTLDVCIKSNIAKSISFNENLQSSQEYNYYSKLVLVSVKAIFIDQVVSLRRKHDDSIRSVLKGKKTLDESYFKASWFTYLDTQKNAERPIRHFLLNRCIDLILELKQIPINSKLLFITSIFKEFKIGGVYFILMMLSNQYFNRSYYFKTKLKRTIDL